MITRTTIKFDSLNFIKRSELSFVLVLVFLLPLCYLPLMAFPYHSPKSIFLNSIVVVLLSLALLNAAIKKQFTFEVNTLDSAVIVRLCFLVAAYLLFPQYENGLESIKILVSLTIFYFVLQYMLGGEKLDSKRAILFVVKSLAASAVLETILVTIEYVQSPIQSSVNFSYDKPFIFGTFGNPNGVGIFLSACFPFLLLLTKNAQSKIWKIIVLSCSVWTLVMIIITKSRASWIALGIGIIVMFSPEITRHLKIMNRKIVVVAAMITTILLSAGIMQILNMNIESVRGRLLVWQTSVVMIASSPIIGIGYGNFAVQYLSYQEKFLALPEHNSYLNNAGDVKQAHNEYLEVLAETGIIGFVGFAFIVFSFIYLGFKVYNKVKDESVDLEIRAFYSSGMIILVHSLFDSPLHVLPLYFLFFLNCAVISMYSKKYDVAIISASFNSKQIGLQQSVLAIKRKYVWEINRFGQTILLCIVVVVFLSGIYFITGKTAGLIDWQKGVDSAQKESWNEAITYYAKAQENIPHDGRLKFNLGAAYLNSGKPHDAIPYLEQSLLSFQDKNIFILLSFAYSEVNQNIKAENILKEFSHKFPNLLLPHLLLGKLYYENKRLVEAQEQLGFVLTRKPKIKNEYAEEMKLETKNLMEKIKKQEKDLHKE